MKVAVLGTGMIGRVITRELAHSPFITAVTAVDGVKSAMESCVAAAGGTAQGVVMDLGNEQALTEFLKGFDAAVACLPHSLSMMANRAAVAAGCHLIDLVGSMYPEKLAALDKPAREKGVLLVTGMGVAPGITNVLTARGIDLLDEADEAVQYCGGIPLKPLPPLGYQVVYRLESVMGLYTRPAMALQDGQVVQLPPLSGMETATFPVVGECEAAFSDAHSPAYTLKGKCKNVTEKTVRYAGHFAKMGVLAELGFLNDNPVDVDGVSVRPRRLAMAVLEPQMKGGSHEDATVVRVVVTGKKDGRPAKHVWEFTDVYDNERNYTSMGKTTGFPPVILLEWLAQGKVTERGFLSPEEIVVGDRFDPFIAELAKRGVVVDKAE